MNWHKITDVAQLEDIKKESKKQPVIIFKHSTTCSISATALGRLERNWKQEEVGELKPYYLDLLNYRPISAQIAKDFNVQHESPQLLLIQDENCTFDASHFDISFSVLKEQL